MIMREAQIGKKQKQIKSLTTRAISSARARILRQQRCNPCAKPSQSASRETTTRQRLYDMSHEAALANLFLTFAPLGKLYMFSFARKRMFFQKRRQSAVM